MSAESLLAHYHSWLLSASVSEALTPCADPGTTAQVRQRILEEPDLHDLLQNDAFHFIFCGLQGKADLLLALQHLARAFQTLEQAALNLYITPWRTELHTIKTYSGHYVHALEAALPQDAIFQALARLNYVPEADGTSLKIRVLPEPRALAVAALGFLAAHVECNILANLVSCSGSTLRNGADLIQERRSWRGEDACMERLQKLVVSEPRIVPAAKSSMTVDGVTATPNGEVLYISQFCDDCHEPWDRHVNRGCKMVTEHHGCHDQVPRVDFVMHDCVFSEQSLQQCCAPCCTFHSFSCSDVRVCRDNGHRVTQMTSSEKTQAVMEEQRRKHQLHSCLQPGQLPHYRCSQCRQLHYIKCKGVLRCRDQGHNATMIMLERNQRLWLQRSLMDLTLLYRDAPASRSGLE
ncbi:spermatogenesis-associated protein 2-like protein isoform X2 [Bufo bufo]|nr:spermatogenesis-associated protein 2-like protein isoform X2 [Bufo bufo]